MSVRPVQAGLPASAPPVSGRRAGESSATPAVPSQSGASALAAAVPGNASAAGTIPASGEQPVNGPPRSAAAVDSEALTAAVERAQKMADAQVRDFSFSIHEKTGKVVVRVIDRASKEVIRQIPAEEMLRIAENLKALEGENKPGMLLRQEV